jgi:hypothetical protein
MLEITDEIKKEAEISLEENKKLPIELAEAPGFWLAEGDDNSVTAFGAVRFQGKSYKIGTKNEE